MTKDSISHCHRLINEIDHDHYLTTLYARSQKREALFALYAFGYEISTIARTVSEPMIGEIRLQWWREAVDGIFDGKRRPHEIMPALATAIQQNDLPRNQLIAMIDGRAAALYRGREAGNDLGENPEDYFEDYLARTEGNLACLAVYISGQRDIDDLARGLGIAWGYVALMLSAAVVRPVMLPVDQPEKLKSMVMDFCRRARRHLYNIAKSKSRIDPETRPVFLLSALIRSYIRTIEKADYNVFELRLEAAAMSRHWRLLTAALFNRI
ncbi:MAG: squalene/phytoene synthase family protein [Alphaproteobacteria bacterium]|nr:squalene/phytoene synthase family protein [Alphaproteobacteria bacterium]